MFIAHFYKTQWLWNFTYTHKLGFASHCSSFLNASNPLQSHFCIKRLFGAQQTCHKSNGSFSLKWDYLSVKQRKKIIFYLMILVLELQVKKKISWINQHMEFAHALFLFYDSRFVHWIKCRRLSFVLFFPVSMMTYFISRTDLS